MRSSTGTRGRTAIAAVAAFTVAALAIVNLLSCAGRLLRVTIAVMLGAGDIALCGRSGTVFTTGDNAQRSGTAAEFKDSYGPSWGRHKARTKTREEASVLGTPLLYPGKASSPPSAKEGA